MTIICTTGRTYNGPQTLVITVEQVTLDEPWVGFRTVTATFKDASRRIAGRVQTIVYDRTDTVVSAVLSQYDSGNYVTLTYQEAA